MQVKCWLIEQYVNIALTILLRPLGHAMAALQSHII